MAHEPLKRFEPKLKLTLIFPTVWPVPDMTYKVFGGTLSLTQSTTVWPRTA